LSNWDFISEVSHILRLADAAEPQWYCPFQETNLKSLNSIFQRTPGA
jgi:hypothetical protein